MGFCTKCGASLPDGAQFCTSCGTPVGGARPMRQAQPAPQQYSGDNWGAYDDGFSGYSAPKKAAPSNRGILRAMSIIFAIGFLICAFGTSGLVYYHRQVGFTVDEMVEAFGGLGDITQKQINLAKGQLARSMGPQLRCDVIGAERAEVPTVDEYMESNNVDREKAVKAVEDEKKETEEYIKELSAKDLKDRREEMAKSNRENVEKVGFRAVWLIVSAYHTLIMIIGGALMLIALIAWLALGGTSGPLSETTVLPAVIACVALGVILIVVFGLAISPIRAEEMR